MANNAAFTKEFPFLKAVKSAPKKKGCGTCGASNRRRARAFTEIKQRLAGLAGDKKQILKKLLNTERVRLIYRRADNKGVEHTF